MNNSNFNASELYEAKKTLERIRDGYGWLRNACSLNAALEYSGEEGYQLLYSEDSNIADTWKNTGELATEIESKAVYILNNLSNVIDLFIKNTVDNETSSAQSINAINNSIIASKEELYKLDI